MDIFQLTLQPQSAYGTPFAGDTLFGQLCWAIRERFGEARLTKLLEGYCEGKPFLVVSDAFPAGWLPRPHLPDFLIGVKNDPTERKAAKKKVWLPLANSGLPLADWLAGASELKATKQVVLTQNTINRLTGTTGTGPFAPRQIERQQWEVAEGIQIYCCIDRNRLSTDELRQSLADVGLSGFGRDASTGLGKFAVKAMNEWRWPVTDSRHALTLAPCAPVPAALDSGACYYQPQTRFGRHGNIAAVLGQPFKRPILSLRSAAFLSFAAGPVPPFHGRGLGGRQQPISATIPATVHQGYAPLVPLNAELRS